MTKYFILKDRKAVPVSSLEEWAKAFETDRHVAQDSVGDVRISTVFLGINHRFGEGPPLIFESMIFGGQHDQEQRRYSTWGEAEKGHAELLALVRSTLQ